MGQQPFGQQRGEVLVGSRHGQGVAWVGSGKKLHALLRAGRPFVDQALLFEVPIEQRMDAAVSGLLSDEAAHLVGKLRMLLGRHGFVPALHSVDEELLPHREAHRQRIEERRAKRIAAAPVAVKRRFQVNEQASHDEFGHGDGSPGAR